MKTTRPTEVIISTLEQFANTDKDYLQLKNETAEFIADILLDCKTQQTQDRGLMHQCIIMLLHKVLLVYSSN